MDWIWGAKKKKKKDIRDDSQAFDSRCYVRGKKSLLKWGGQGEEEV